VRPEVERLLAVDEAARLREEDPHTAAWTELSDTRITVQHSRFEVDLNRPRELAIYATPEQAWNLVVYRERLATQIAERSLAAYDAFYAALEELLRERVRLYGGFVLFDLHSYNHRRGGPTAPAADSRSHPEVNLGTGSMDRERWAPVVERFSRELCAQRVLGSALDVRENVKFFGGQLPRWVHERFGEVGCALAIEVKKTFMNEWTGELDTRRHASIGRALAATVPAVIEELCKLTQRTRRRIA
jgi:N-formylglutamate amidohydrolase